MKYEILAIVSDEMGVSIQEIMSKSRMHEAKQARHLAAALFSCCGFSTVQTARYLNRNHATIINSEKRVCEYLETEGFNYSIIFMRCLTKVSASLRQRRIEPFLNSLEKGIVKMDISSAFHVREFCQIAKRMLGIITPEDIYHSGTMRQMLMRNVEAATGSEVESHNDIERVSVESMESQLLNI